MAVKLNVIERDHRYIVRAPYALKDALKAIPGARWDKVECAWTYPASLAVLREFAARFTLESLPVELVTAARESQSVEAPPMPAKLTPWAHQREGYSKAYREPAFMLGLDMGCGKTLCAIALCNAWQARKILVVCPLPVLPVWPQEFAKHSLQQYRCVELNGKRSVANRLIEAKKQLALAVPTVLVINYDSVWREPFGAWVLSQKWDVVIADESHRIKAPGGKASMFMAKVTNHATHRLALTGTPMPHSPLDVYGQYRYLDPGIFGTSFTMFRSRYAVMGGYQGHQVLHYQNEDELHKKFYSIGFRVMKRDVLDLPAVIHEERFCTLDAKERKAYNELEEQFYTWVESAGAEVTIQNALVKLLRLQQVTSGHLKADDDSIISLGTTKADMLSDVLEDLPPGEPVVVFCRFVHDLDEVRRVAAATRTVAELSGRLNELALWQAGKCDLLAAQIQAGSEGIDLTRACYCVFYSIGFSLSQFEQALARTDRPGQKRSVTVLHLIAKDTIDVKVYRTLRDRKKVVESILKKDAFSPQSA